MVIYAFIDTYIQLKLFISPQDALDLLVQLDPMDPLDPKDELVPLVVKAHLVPPEGRVPLDPKDALVPLVDRERMATMDELV